MCFGFGFCLSGGSLFLLQLLQGFVGGEVVHRVFVVAVKDVVLETAVAFSGGKRGKLGLRRQDEGSLHDAGHAFFIKEGHQRLAHAQFGNRLRHIEIRIAAEGFGGSAHGFLIARGKGTQGVLHAVAELAEHGVGQVERVLGNEIDAHAFGTDQTHHLLNLLEQGIGGVVEQQMSLVKEHNEFGFVQIAGFGQGFKQFSQKPQQERAIEPRRTHQLFGIQDIDYTLPAFGLQPVLQIKLRLAEKHIAALAFQLQQLALNGADAGGGNVAVLGAVFLGVLSHVLQHAAQVFQIDQMPAFIVSGFEYQVEQAFLRVVQPHQAGEQQGAHFGNGDAHGNTGFAVYIPKAHWAAFQVAFRIQPELSHALAHLALPVARVGDAGEVALHVAHKHGNALRAEAFGHFAQGNGFARAGGAGNQAVAVGHLAEQE